MKQYSEELIGDRHTAVVSSSQEVLVVWQGIPLGTSKGRSKWSLRGSGKLEIDNPGKGTLDCQVTTKQKFVGEHLDKKAPPEIAPPVNWLQAMRRKIALEMGTTREAFAERMSIYEMGDVDVFEEDLARNQETNQETKHVENESHNAEISDDNSTLSESSPEQKSE